MYIYIVYAYICKNTCNICTKTHEWINHMEWCNHSWWRHKKGSWVWLLTPLSVDPKANSIGAAMYFMGCNLASNQLGERKKWRSFKRFQLIVRRGSLGNSAAELSAAGCKGCSSVVYAKLGCFSFTLVFWSVLGFRTSAMFIKPRIGEIGDLNNVRLTGYLILVVAVLIIFGGIKHLGYMEAMEARHVFGDPKNRWNLKPTLRRPRYVSRLGTLFLMVVLSWAERGSCFPCFFEFTAPRGSWFYVCMWDASWVLRRAGLPLLMYLGFFFV